MQCGELVYRKVTTMTKGSRSQSRPEKETIHSGHFMVSHFEAEAQDDEDNLAVPVPEEDEVESKFTVDGIVPVGSVHAFAGTNKDEKTQQQISIETSLNKLFQCMSLAYRQKLTSPKWNRFKGIKLRWKDKIRLNNVIWRCWHLQFIMKRNTLVCPFASPLDVDTHIKPEATILEGKYWKRRVEAVTAEYKTWRMYYRNRALGWGPKDVSDVISDMDVLDWHSQGDSHMLADEDYIAFMSDTLFSTISSNQPFAFPDAREIARVASLADFIQPSLGPLQPNLDDFMDTFEPLQELFTAVKLPPVPEESATSDDHMYRNNISQALMNTNFQQALDHTTQYSIAPMQTQIHNVPSQLPHQQNRQGNIHPVSDQMMSHGAMAANIQIVNDNYIARQSEQNAHSLHPTQSTSQNSAGSHGNRNNPMSPMSSQRQSIMVQPYGMSSPNMVAQQNSGMMSQHQNVMQNQHQQLHNQKMYPQIPVINYHEGTYGNQGMHQSRPENSSFGTASQRARAGSGGYPPERMSRSRPSQSYPHHFNSPSAAPSQPDPLIANPDKNSYEQHIDRLHRDHHPASSNSNSGNLAQINLSAGSICMNLNNSSEQQNVSAGAANLSLQGSGRFKMPSPPPQIGNSSMSTHNRQMSPGSGSQQHQQAVKGENFRSNSLPVGATLASLTALTSASALGATRPRRRPRSGSSSPSPAQPRRAPLLAAASEPALSPSSVLLAHLLNTNKSQGIYKPGSVQSLTSEGGGKHAYLTHQMTILPAPPSGPVTVPASFSSSSPQLSNFGGSSPTNATSPQSPPSPVDGCGGPGREHRRTGHIHAEQKRRYNIKNGFDVLQSLIPQLSQNPNAKVSKAAMLQKGAEYVRQLQGERNQMKEEMDGLRQQIECLNNSISNCQSLLPATGAPVSRQRSGRLKEMFDDYVCQRTNDNWKFWIFSLLVEPLLISFNNNVSPASTDELRRSTFLWAEQHCSLVEMRPAVLNSLRMLCTTTEILSDPDRLPEEAHAAVNKKKPKDSNSSCK